MGARGRNFYFDLACRYGYEEAAVRLQELYLAGRRPEAEAAVPDALVDEVALCGPPERIRERLAPWRAAGVTTLICATTQPEAIRVMAGLGPLSLEEAPGLLEVAVSPGPRRPAPPGHAGSPRASPPDAI